MLHRFLNNNLFISLKVVLNLKLHFNLNETLSVKLCMLFKNGNQNLNFKFQIKALNLNLKQTNIRFEPCAFLNLKKHMTKSSYILNFLFKKQNKSSFNV